MESKDNNELPTLEELKAAEEQLKTLICGE